MLQQHDKEGVKKMEWLVPAIIVILVLGGIVVAAASFFSMKDDLSQFGYSDKEQQGWYHKADY